MIFKGIKFILGNFYALSFIFLPYIFFRFIIPFILDVLPQVFLDEFLSFSAESVVAWANSRYWMYMGTYLVISHVFTLSFDADQALDSERGTDWFQSIEDQQVNTFENMIAWVHLILLPGKLVMHVFFKNLRLIGLCKSKSSIENMNEKM